MTDQKRSTADGAALAALFIVALIVNVSIAAFTELEVVPRWALTVGAGIIAAATTYAVVSRRGKKNR